MESGKGHPEGGSKKPASQSTLRQRLLNQETLQGAEVTQKNQAIRFNIWFAYQSLLSPRKFKDNRSNRNSSELGKAGPFLPLSYYSILSLEKRSCGKGHDALSSSPSYERYWQVTSGVRSLPAARSCQTKAPADCKGAKWCSNLSRARSESSSPCAPGPSGQSRCPPTHPH